MSMVLFNRTSITRVLRFKWLEIAYHLYFFGGQFPPVK